MPVTWCYSIMESDQPYCTTRFPVGCFITPEGVKHDACYLSVSENVLNVTTHGLGFATHTLYTPTHPPRSCVVSLLSPSLSPSLPRSLSLSFSLSPQNLLSEKGATYVFNHVHLLISYHKGSEQNKFTDGRIVRAQVQLASCKKFPCTAKSEPLKLPKPKDINKQFDLTYSYTVEFIVSWPDICLLCFIWMENLSYFFRGRNPLISVSFVRIQ